MSQGELMDLDSSETKQICLLCQRMADLQQSHIVPASVFRWLKRISMSGSLRSALEPNRRIQDGPKRLWLCRECEGRLNCWETSFANGLFHPILANGTDTHRYSSWMALFCASLCWRTLKLALLECECSFLQPGRADLAEKALNRWREFMFGREPNPGEFGLHFVPLYGIQSVDGGGLCPFINRYLALGVDAEILEDQTNLLVYVKLPSMVILGMVEPESPNAWKRIRVRIGNGSIYPRPFTLPEVLLKFLNYRAFHFAGLSKNLSPFQRNKITGVLEADHERTSGSAYMQALRQDVGLSGLEAALPRYSKAEDE